MAESIRLTGNIRSAITKAILTHRFLERETIYWDMTALLAKQIYRTNYDQSLILSLPKDWLPKEDHILCSFGLDNNVVKLPFNGSPFYGKEIGWTPVKRAGVYYPMPANFMSHYPQYEKDHRIVSIYDNLRLNILCYIKELSKAQADVHNLLASFETTDELVSYHKYMKPFVESVVSCE